MRGLVLLIAASFLLPGSLSAETLVPIAEFHNFKNGPSAIQKTFDAAWRGNSDFFYQIGSCTHGPSLSENDSRRDERPIKIRRTLLLGAKSRAATVAAYLVQGNRMIWLERSGTGSEFVELPCTWLVSFNGNKVQIVREADDLYYLMTDSKDG